MGLSEHEKRVVLAIGQAMFPRDATLPYDADDVDVVAWCDDYAARMPPFSRAQIRALINAFEYGYAAWAGRPRDTFSSARPADRVAYLESWERSSTYAQRMLYEALRAMLTFAYVGSDEVEAAIRPADSRSDDYAPRVARGRAVEEPR